VSDALTVVPNFKGPRLNMQMDQNSGNTGTGVGGATGGGGGSGGSGGLFTSDTAAKTEEGNTMENRKEMQEAFMGVIKDTIGGDLWQPTGKGSIRIFQGQMVVTQTLLGFKLMESSGTVK